jgi:hypothetical protein
MTDTGHPNPNDHGAGDQKRGVSGDVTVSGKILIEASPKERLSRDTAEKNQDTKDRKKWWLEVTTLVVVSIYASLTAWQGCLTHKIAKTAQDTYAAVDRPYIGVNHISVELAGPDEQGRIVNLDNSPEKATRMAFIVEVKNFGSVPGENLRDKCDMIVNGQKVPSHRIPSDAPELFPGQFVTFEGAITGDVYKGFTQGKNTLQLEVSAEYTYGKEQYHYCERFQYGTPGGPAKFITIGPKCEEPWPIGQ